MRYRFHTLDVFTDRTFGGNPLAVFPDARGLAAGQMQRIAAELNLSETVFVLPPEAGGTRRVRIFTPRVELPFAGHPTVGTAILLVALGMAPSAAGGTTTVTLEEGVGAIPVTVRTPKGVPTFAQFTAAKLPEVGPPPPPREELAAMLSLAAEDLPAGGLEPAAVSCGLPFLFVPVRDRAAVGRAMLDLGCWARVLQNYWTRMVFVFAMDPELPGSHARARMFAPEAGVLEDPATGSAAAAFAGYLGVREPGPNGVRRWVIEQGFEMGRPSLIHAEADVRDGAVTAVRVGGSAVRVTDCEIEVPA
jgi:trans-2,3-dihydro-3-hydroxyanthranilate isomerase